MSGRTRSEAADVIRHIVPTRSRDFERCTVGVL